MIFISSKNSSEMELVDNENNFWIHRVDSSLIKTIDESKIIGSKYLSSNNSKFKDISLNDEILLYTWFNGEIIFYGLTKVESILKDDNEVYGFYINKTKLKIKRIKYFLEPFFIDDFYEDVTFVRNKENFRDYFRSEYKNISKQDFEIIKNGFSLTGMFPVYFDEYSMNMKDFLLNSIRSLYNILKTQDYSQIEINEFLSLLKLSLKGYGIDKDVDDLKRFYSRYAHELGFKHIPSRDPKKFVVLLTPSGEKKNFAYISLE